MSIRALHAHPFLVPYAGRYATARGEGAARYGVLVTLATDVGVIGLGEASPYPGPGEREAQRAVASVILEVAPRMLGCALEEAEEALDRALAAVEAEASVKCAVRAGVEIALWDARGLLAGAPVAELLSRALRLRVPVNALVADPTVEGACAAARDAVNAGFRSVKLKVGAAASVEDERARVAAVREAVGPGVALRLDANGAWSVERAIATLRAVREYGIEYVEQPVPPDDLDGMRAVRAVTGVRVAADESVTDAGAALRLLDAGAADALVVKPVAVGGLGPALRIARLAAVRGVPVTVTTTIDSGVGVAAALHLAATLPEGSPACGLATAHLLESDLLSAPLRIEDGVMSLGERPGLGVQVDFAALGRYALPVEEART